MHWSAPSIKFSITLLIALLMAVLATVSAKAVEPQATNVYEVSTVGYAPLDGNRANARRTALAEAQRLAVEEAAGAFMASGSLLSDYELVRDEILSRSDGYIQSYVIDEEALSGNEYKVAITAFVVKSRFIDAVQDSLENLYDRVGMPRLMLVIYEVAEDADGNPTLSVNNRAGRFLSAQLLKEGFTFIEPSSLPSGGYSERAKRALMTMAQDNGTEILIIGNAEASNARKKDSFVLIDVFVNLQSIAVENKQILASSVVEARGMGVTRTSAVVNGFERAIDKIVIPLKEQLSTKWIKESSQGSSIDVVIRNTSFTELEELQKLASAGAGVSRVELLSFKDNTALLEVISHQSSLSMANGLLSSLKRRRLPYSIEEVTSNRITLVRNDNADDSTADGSNP